jgi:hypothetical protein
LASLAESGFDQRLMQQRFHIVVLFSLAGVARHAAGTDKRSAD